MPCLETMGLVQAHFAKYTPFYAMWTYSSLFFYLDPIQVSLNYLQICFYLLKRPEERTVDVLVYASSSSTEVCLIFGGVLTWLLRWLVTMWIVSWVLGHLFGYLDCIIQECKKTSLNFNQMVKAFNLRTKSS